MQFEYLLRPGKIGKLELKNRVVYPAMGKEMGGPDGEVTDTTVKWYSRRARGGVALITIEPTATATEVEPFRVNDRAMRIDHPRFIPGMSGLVKAIHDNGAKAGIQLTPGGGSSDYGGPWDRTAKNLSLVSPSGIPSPGSDHKPRALSTAEVERMVELTGISAKHAKEAGFDLIEFHAHYGYLIAEFMSPYFNHRDDKYGGSMENRLRFLMELIAEVRKVTGAEFPLVVKYSVDEYIDGGRSIEESLAIARKLEEASVDAITVSAGVAGGKRMPTNPPYFLPRGCWVHLGEAVKKVVKIPVILPGRLNDPRLAEQVLRKGKADFIAEGRALIADPDWPNKVANGQPEEVRWCISCNECRQTVIVKKLSLRCSVNAVAGREGEFDTINPAETKKRVVVIGGGPAGLEAARVAALRGHQVTLLERRKNLGGLMAIASIHNEEVGHFTSYLIRQVKKLPIDVRTGVEATPALVQGMKPDAVIIADGGVFPKLNIPGISRKNVFSSQDLLNLVNGVPIKKGALLSLLTTLGRPFITVSLVRRFLNGDFPIKKNVIVLGGQFAGCSLGLYLAKKGKKLTVLEETDHIGNDMEYHTLIAFNVQVEKGNIKVFTSTKAMEITSNGVTAIDNNQKQSLYQGDTVIIAKDPLPSTNSLARELEGKVKQIYTIGDARSFRRIMTAISEGFETAYRL